MTSDCENLESFRRRTIIFIQSMVKENLAMQYELRLSVRDKVQSYYSNTIILTNLRDARKIGLYIISNCVIFICIDSQEMLDSLIFCNLYRKQTDRFEKLVSTAEFSCEFPSFMICVNGMLKVINVERQRKTNAKQTIPVKEENAKIMRRLTRTENWRIILLWLFFEKVVECPSNLVTENVESAENRSLRELIETMQANVEIFREDMQILAQASVYTSVSRLRNACLEKLRISALRGINFVCSQITDMSRGFCAAYQSCSEELKRFEKLKTPDHEVTHIRKMITKSTDEDDYVIGQCLEIIVTVGKNL